jgi:hypothetical protein
MFAIRNAIISLVVAALATIGLIPLLAYADSGTGTLALTAGTLSETTGAIPTVSAQLNGTDLNKSFTLPINITDATGTGNGWNITISESNFAGTIAGTPVTLGIDPSVSGEGNSCGAGATCTLASNSVTYPLTVPLAGTPATKLINAAVNSGLASISSTGTLNITIPANTKVATYTSTITIAVISGP